MALFRPFRQTPYSSPERGDYTGETKNPSSGESMSISYRKANVKTFDLKWSRSDSKAPKPKSPLRPRLPAGRHGFSSASRTRTDILCYPLTARLVCLFLRNTFIFEYSINKISIILMPKIISQSVNPNGWVAKSFCRGGRYTAPTSKTAAMNTAPTK